MKGKRLVILIILICASAVFTFCGCASLSLQQDSAVKAPVPVPPENSSGFVGEDSVISSPGAVINAEFAFNPISETECEVSCANLDDVTYAEIPEKAVIDGKEYTVTRIAERAFYNVVEGVIHRIPLREVKLPSTVKQIGDIAFDFCRYLTEINLGGVETIGVGALRDCESLVKADLTSVKTIGSQAFLDCDKLESVFMPAAEEIGNGAFGLCPELSEAVIPKTASKMGADVFLYSNTAVKVVKGADTQNWDVNWNWGNENQNVIYDYLIPAELKYKKLNDTQCMVYFCLNRKYAMIAEIPQTAVIDGKEYAVTEICRPAFTGCPELEKVVLPDTIAVIHEAAFCLCPKLSIIIIPESVGTVGGYIFAENNTQVCVVADSKPEGWHAGWNRYNENQSVIWGWFEGKAVLNYNPISETECEVSCANLDDVTYAEIPEKAVIDGKEYTVTRIAERAFYNVVEGVIHRIPLREVKLPSTVKQIGDIAFDFCRYLTEINLGGVETIGVGALRDCESLVKADLTSVKTIGSQAFLDCDKLESVFMPAAEEIGNGAFGLCPELSEAVIPKTASKMGADVFLYSNTAVKVVKGADTQNWDVNWNWGNENQNVIYDYLIPAELKYKKLNDTQCMVYFCLNRKYAMIAEIPQTAVIDGKEYTVTEIFNTGFSNCPELEKVVLPDTIAVIHNTAFCRCPKLSIIIIPESVGTVGKYIFAKNNTQVCVVADSKPEGWDDIWNKLNENQNVIWGWKDGDVLAEFTYLPVDEENKLCSVECTNPTKATVALIPEKVVIDGEQYTVTHIADDCFWLGGKLERVILPDTVLVVGHGAFVGCESLTEISLPNAQIIYDSAFAECSKLQSIELPKARAIYQMAFEGCSALSLAEIPKAEYIEIYAFADCYALKEIIIPKSAAKVMGGILDDCNTQVYAEAEEKPAGWDENWNRGNANQNVIWGWTDSIARFTFSIINETECEVRIANKGTAVEAYIPSTAVIDGKEYTVTRIALNGFFHCPKLKKVVLSPTVKKIGNNAFALCPELSSVTLVNVEEIGNNAFYRCTKLKELVIPKSVVYVGACILRYNDTKVYVRGPSDEGWNPGWNVNNSGEAEFNSTYYKPIEIN